MFHPKDLSKNKFNTTFLLVEVTHKNNKLDGVIWNTFLFKHATNHRQSHGAKEKQKIFYAQLISTHQLGGPASSTSGVCHLRHLPPVAPATSGNSTAHLQGVDLAATYGVWQQRQFHQASLVPFSNNNDSNDINSVKDDWTWRKSWTDLVWQLSYLWTNFVFFDSYMIIL